MEELGSGEHNPLATVDEFNKFAFQELDVFCGQLVGSAFEGLTDAVVRPRCRRKSNLGAALAEVIQVVRGWVGELAHIRMQVGAASFESHKFSPAQAT
jgi:hypothetical protein